MMNIILWVVDVGVTVIFCWNKTKILIIIIIIKVYTLSSTVNKLFNL